MKKPFLLVMVLAGCAPAPPAREEAPRLVALINERLALMPDVARWKWNEGKPIADPAREKAMLDAIAARAEEKGIDRRLAVSFFRAQVEAAKLVQQAAFDKWKDEKRGKFDKVPSLADLRKKIDEATGAMLLELDRPLPRTGFGAIKGEFVTEAARKAAVAPLEKTGTAGR